MSVDQTTTVDFVTLDRGSGNIWLTISDHLPWDEEEGKHLLMLQEKFNAYLKFVESGELQAKFPELDGRHIVINFVGKYPLSLTAKALFRHAKFALMSVQKLVESLESDVIQGSPLARRDLADVECRNPRPPQP